MSNMFLRSGVLCALLTPALAWGDEAPVVPRLAPGGGVVDTAGKNGYWPNGAGGIDAVELATGKVLWKSKAASKPLLASQNRLVAQALVADKSNQIRVLIFDTQEGKLLLQSAAISLPDWVSVGTALGRSFHSTAQMDNNAVLLIWEARAWYAGGAAPPPAVEGAARKEASGVLQIHVQTGQMSKVDQPPVDAPRPTSDEVNSVKIGDLTLSVVEQPGRRPFQQRRFVHAANAKGALVWQHEIAGKVFLPPPP